MSDIVKKDSAIVAGSSGAFEGDRKPAERTPEVRRRPSLGPSDDRIIGRNPSILAERMPRNAFGEYVERAIESSLNERDVDGYADAIIAIMKMDRAISEIVRVAGVWAVDSETRETVMELTRAFVSGAKQGSVTEDMLNSIVGKSWRIAVEKACRNISDAREAFDVREGR